MHVKLAQCLMENKFQLNVRSFILLFGWKYVSPPPIVQNDKLIPELLPGTGSALHADFKSIFYHSAFQQHYTTLYCCLFLECRDHSLTLVHSLLFYLLLCDACGFFFCVFVCFSIASLWILAHCPMLQEHVETLPLPFPCLQNSSVAWMETSGTQGWCLWDSWVW